MLALLADTKRLRSAGRDGQAEVVLNNAIDKLEGHVNDEPVEHWFYEHLAVLYHERGDHTAEVGVLERFARQKPASAKMADMMATRLEAARNELPPP